MIQDIKPYLEHVKGNTYCIVTGYLRIPLYRLSSTKAILIDSGFSWDWEGILGVLQQNNLRITSVLTSHAHPDHIGNHLNLRNQFGAKLCASLFSAAVNASPMNLLSSIAHTGTYQQLSHSNRTYFLPDEIIDWTNPSITVDGVTFQILQLSGHSAEHMGFVTPDSVAYLGDLILSEPLIRSLSMPYCTCLELDIQAKEKIADSHYDRYILAHNGVYDEIRELALLNQDNLLQKADLVESLIDCPLTKNELVSRFLSSTGKDVNSPRKVHGIQYNITALITYLIDKGRLTETVQNGAVYYVRPDNR